MRHEARKLRSVTGTQLRRRTSSFRRSTYQYSGEMKTRAQAKEAHVLDRNFKLLSHF